MKTTTRLWRCIETLTLQAGVTADWRLALGNEFGAASPFLRPTAGQASDFPCTHRFPCGCRHRVVLHSPSAIVAVCDETDCPPIRLQPTDILVMELNLPKLGAAVAGAVRFKPLAWKACFDRAIRAELIGMEGPLPSPVYLMVAHAPDELARRVAALMRQQEASFLLVTPTARRLTLNLEAGLARHGCLHVALEDHLEVAPDGRLLGAASFEAVRAEFARRLTEGRGLVKTIERFDRNLEAVAKGNYELQQQVDELRQFQADGFFQFALRVDGRDFQAFAVIMALGNRSAAAKFLKVPHRSFYDLVDKWSSRGKEYQRMARWIEWRKRNGRKIKVRLEDSLQSGEPNQQPENPETIGAVLDSISTGDNRDYPDILRQVLAALREQNPRNWQGVRQELVEMIEEEVMQ